MLDMEKMIHCGNCIRLCAMEEICCVDGRYRISFIIRAWGGARKYKIAYKILKHRWMITSISDRMTWICKRKTQITKWSGKRKWKQNIVRDSIHSTIQQKNISFHSTNENDPTKVLWRLQSDWGETSVRIQSFWENLFWMLHLILDFIAFSVELVLIIIIYFANQTLNGLNSVN